MPVYDKLVRDLIPEHLARLGIGCRTRVLDEGEYWQRLLDKLSEEATELGEATSEEKRREELADLLEVARALAELLGGQEAIEQVRLEKARERGGFARRLLLLDTDD